MVRRSYLPLFCLLLFFICLHPVTSIGGYLPSDFVYVEDTVPGIGIEMRYFSNLNFVGERIDGYTAPRCILTKEAAQGLRGVQEDLNRFGLGLKIYDAYRP